ncbi:MAG: hypothetical protein AAF509_16935 [Pseudomonadota bacterium]
MKPQFALSMTFEGIGLLHRAAGGWRTVGEVSLESDDLTAALRDLRADAEEIAPGAVYTKLLLPNEQIRYLTIDTAGMDDLERRAAAAQALESATPYAVLDLAYDISAAGDQTHVAAVAQDTLAEAEAFAIQHAFRPLSFAAVPGENAYLGEPFFGLTSVAASLLPDDEDITPDGIAVVVIGDVADKEQAVAAVPPAPPPDLPPSLENDTLPEAPADAEEPSGSADTPTFEAADRQETAAQIPLAGSGESEAQDESVPAISFASRRAAEQKKRSEPNEAVIPKVTAPAVPIMEPPEDLPAPETASKDETSHPELPPAPTPSSEPVPQPFLSQLRAPAKAHLATDDGELERMTVFGARQSQASASPPRMTGMILTAACLVFLAGFAAIASVVMSDSEGFTALFGREAPEVDTAAPLAPQAPSDPVDEPPVQTASLTPVLTEEDTAVLDALSTPEALEPPKPLTDTEIDARYAARGIWSRAPLVPPLPVVGTDGDDVYLARIEPVAAPSDAIALLPLARLDTDRALEEVASPAAAGTRFNLDARGLVVPTPQGSLSPDGILVYLGSPPAVPPSVMARAEPDVPDTAAEKAALAAFRPSSRPADLLDKIERSRLGGLSRGELAAFRPALRPISVQEQAEQLAAAATASATASATDAAVTEALATPEDPFATATRRAVSTSLRPDNRPRSFARRTPAAPEAREDTRVASAAAIAPRTVTPAIPSRASVAKAATTRNALNLRNINLIGVYGKPSNRRALARLSNGRYKKVVVGDRIDGGTVLAIGDGELRYKRRGRDIVLRMPR